MKSNKKGSSTGSSGHKQSRSKLPPSKTVDILGGTTPKTKPPKIQSKWARQHRTLVDLRNRLLIQAGKLAKEATEGTPTYSMHMADAGTDSFDRDFALSMLSSDQEALYEIEEAIRRIENGTYGRCELTGKPIPAGRLEAIPWARFSAEAQRQLERDGALKQRRLSAFSSLPAADITEPDEADDGGEAPEKE